MPTPPSLTAQQRFAASALAVTRRVARAQVRARLRTGRLSLSGALALAQRDDDPVAEAVSAMRVRTLLESLPGVGPQRAEDAMAAIGIAPGRRVRGLGRSQRAAVLARFEPPRPA